MELTVGTILEGKVKSIASFGAFITLPENKTGMVHISEVANAYVTDIRQYLTEGQDVRVMVIGLDGSKINLSIKRLEPKPQRENRSRQQSGRSSSEHRQSSPAQQSVRAAAAEPAEPKTSDELFEERLKQFMTESDSKISSMRQYADHRTRKGRK